MIHEEDIIKLRDKIIKLFKTEECRPYSVANEYPEFRGIFIKFAVKWDKFIFKDIMEQCGFRIHGTGYMESTCVTDDFSTIHLSEQLFKEYNEKLKLNKEIRSNIFDLFDFIKKQGFEYIKLKDEGIFEYIRIKGKFPHEFVKGSLKISINVFNLELKIEKDKEVIFTGDITKITEKFIQALDPGPKSMEEPKI